MERVKSFYSRRLCVCLTLVFLQACGGAGNAHLIRGSRLQQEGRSDEALAEYRKAAKEAPDDPDVHFNMGVVLYLKGDLEEAEREFQQALAIKPDHPGANSGLGYVYYAREMIDEAERHFRAAAEALPDDPDMKNNLGVVLKALGRNREAERKFREALEVKPESVYRYNLAGTLRRQGKREEALKEYRKVSAQDPEYSKAYYYAGVTLAEEGKLKEATEEYRKAADVEAKRAGESDAERMKSRAALIRYREALDSELEIINTAKKKKPSLGLLVLKFDGPKEPEKLSDIALKAVRSRRGVRRVSQESLLNGLSAEAAEDLRNCRDLDCMARAARTGKAKYVLLGQVSEEGRRFGVKLALVDGPRGAAERKLEKDFSGGSKAFYPFFMSCLNDVLQDVGMKNVSLHDKRAAAMSGKGPIPGQVGLLILSGDIKDSSFSVDGVLFGRVNDKPVVLDPGTHRVEVMRRGFFPLKQEVAVKGGSATLMQVMGLRPLPKAPPKAKARSVKALTERMNDMDEGFVSAEELLGRLAKSSRELDKRFRRWSSGSR